MYQVVDGQQRLRAIYKFLDGKLAIPKYGPEADGVGIYEILGKQYDLRGKKWTDDDFPDQVQKRFDSYTISVKVYQRKSEPEIAR